MGLTLACVLGIGSACTDTDTDPNVPVATNAGPLADAGGGDHGTMCIPADKSGRATYSLDTLRNPTDATIVVDEVTVKAPQGLTVVGTQLVPLSGAGIASSPGYPPVALQDERFSAFGFDWDKRSPAAGGTIPPGGVATVAVGVLLDDRETQGRFAKLQIDYHSGSNHYQIQTSTEFLVVPFDKKC